MGWDIRTKSQLYNAIMFVNIMFYFIIILSPKFSGFPETFKNGSIRSMNRKLKCKNDVCTQHDWDEAQVLLGYNM